MTTPVLILGSLQAHAVCVDVIRGGTPRASGQPISAFQKSSKCLIAGKVWKSQQNGYVYDPCGVAPCLCVGHHSGVEPKIIEYEKNQEIP